MNKHTRLAAGILVLVLVILIAATISFSANVSKRSGSNQNSASDTAINANGNEIVQGTTTFTACRMRQEIRFSNRSGNNSNL